MGIRATRFCKRVNSFNFNEHEVYVSADVCHLLKNIKSAMLSQIIYLPNEFVETEKLPTNIVDGKYIVQLWNYEVNNVGANNYCII